MWIKMAALIVLLMMGAWGERNGAASVPLNGQEAPAPALEPGETKKEEAAVENENRRLIAGALGIEEDSRNLRFILNALNTIGAGQLQSARMEEAEGEAVVYVVGEDGTGYGIYLSGSGGVEAVKNLDRDEWVIQSER